MWAVVDEAGEVEASFDASNLDEVAREIDRALPKHTPVFLAEDPEQLAVEGLLRRKNPVGGAPAPVTPIEAMERTGLRWPITFADMAAAGFPLTKEGYLAAHHTLVYGNADHVDLANGLHQGFFPNSPALHAYALYRDPNAVREDFLRQNEKTKKGMRGVGRAIPPSRVVGLSLLPYSLARVASGVDVATQKAAYEKTLRTKGLFQIRFQALPIPKRAPDGEPTTLCAQSTPECRMSCLIYSGQNQIVKYNDVVKLETTRAFYFAPEAAIRVLVEAIEGHVLRSRKAGQVPFVRLNVYSDIPWEHYCPDLFAYFGDRYPDVQFYDYTKLPGRSAHPLPNYDLTFSFSGSNLAACRHELETGTRVTAVFLRRKASGSKKKLDYRRPESLKDLRFLGRAVIDGDKYDMRPFDPPDVCVGLRFKPPQKVVGKTREERAARRIAKAGSFLIDPSRSYSPKFLVYVEESPDQPGVLISTVTPSQTGAPRLPSAAE